MRGRRAGSATRRRVWGKLSESEAQLGGGKRDPLWKAAAPLFLSVLCSMGRSEDIQSGILCLA
jgi:hypothetical protein